MWNAGKDTLLALQDQLPKPRKQFGILLQAPWDRAYKGRLEDKLVPHDPIVPREVTTSREAAMGPATLVVASAARDLVEAPRRPIQRGGLPPRPLAVAGDKPASPGASLSKRPRSFAEDWRARGTPRPPTTIANAAADIQPPPTVVARRSIGDRYRRRPDRRGEAGRRRRAVRDVPPVHPAVEPVVAVPGAGMMLPGNGWPVFGSTRTTVLW